MAFPSACMAVVRKDHKIKMRPPHTGCDGRNGGTLLSLFTSFPAVWAGAFRGGGVDNSNMYYKVRLPHAGVPLEQWPVNPYAEHFHSFSWCTLPFWMLICGCKLLYSNAKVSQSNQ